jgi:hypothetical protein
MYFFENIILHVHTQKNCIVRVLLSIHVSASGIGWKIYYTDCGDHQRCFDKGIIDLEHDMYHQMSVFSIVKARRN